MTLRELQREARTIASAKGFDPASNIPQSLMLTVTELSEALEELRAGRPAGFTHYRESDGKPEGFTVELADAVIRIADLAEALGLDLQSAVIEKMAFNASRPYMHGKEF
jgi:hypothetical protein